MKLSRLLDRFVLRRSLTVALFFSGRRSSRETFARPGGLKEWNSDRWRAGVSIEAILIQFGSVFGGFVLGALTGAWIHAAWKRWHPQTIRFWGSWYTDPRWLLIGGLGLAAAFLAMFFTSNL